MTPNETTAQHPLLPITSDAQYDVVVNRMIELEQLPEAEHNPELKQLAAACEAWDDEHHPMPAPGQ